MAQMNMFPGRLMYAGLASLALLNTVWILALGHTIDWSTFFKSVVYLLCFFSAKICVLKLFDVRLKNQANQASIDSWKLRAVTLCDGLIFMTIGWVVLRLFNHLSMTTGLPYQDDFLVAADQFLPLDWNAYFEFAASSPFLIELFDISYTGLTLLSVLGFFGLILLNEIGKAHFFVVSFVITAIFCTTVGMFFPAKAAVEFLLVDRSLIDNFPYSPGTYSVSIIDKLRGELPHVYNIEKLPGLTTFPSFHTGAGIVLTYAYRKTFLFVPVLIYTLVMISSTPVFGGHYFVDIIAGAIVALVICRVVERSRLFKNVFSDGNERRRTDLQQKPC